MALGEEVARVAPMPRMGDGWAHLRFLILTGHAYVILELEVLVGSIRFSPGIL
jgi:hypothetical protein